MRSYQKKSVRGQGIVEYILITTFVALAAIAIFRTFRDDLSQAYQKAGDALIQGVDDSLSSDPLSGE